MIGIDQSVHDDPEEEDCAENLDSALPPEAARVIIEEDLIGQPASIVYHDVIKQLLDFLVLPINKCSGKDPNTKETCNATKPFEVSVRSRGTAVIAEWVNIRR